MRTETIERALAAVSLLQGLSARQRGRLAARATTRTYREGAVIVREGDTSMALYVVVDGRVRVECTSAAGQPAVQLEDLTPGDVFGEMGLIDDAARSASVVAAEPTQCVLLAKWDFEKPLRDDVEIGLALLRTLSERVRRLEARLAAVAPPS